MKLLTKKIRERLLRNGRDRDGDQVPVIKLFNPAGAATWLLTQLDADGDTLYGLCDLGMGSPELGTVSLSELENFRDKRFNLKIERDRFFHATLPISIYATSASRAGYIIDDERRLSETT